MPNAREVPVDLEFHRDLIRGRADVIRTRDPLEVIS